LFIEDGALVLELRTLELKIPGQTESSSAFSFLGFTLGSSHQKNQDVVEQSYTWKGQTAKVQEKIRVETIDPNVMAALTKVTSLERTISLAYGSLYTVMNGIKH